MALDLVDYQQKTHEAVKAFWGNRAAARLKQIESGKADQGERAGVTAGKNMDGFLALMIDIVRANGLADAELYHKRTLLTPCPVTSDRQSSGIFWSCIRAS